MKVKFQWYKFSNFRMDNGVTFSDFRIFYDHSLCPFQDILITPKGIPTPVRSPSQLSNPSTSDSNPVSQSLESLFLDAEETHRQSAVLWLGALSFTPSIQGTKSNSLLLLIIRPTPISSFRHLEQQEWAGLPALSAVSLCYSWWPPVSSCYRLPHRWCCAFCEETARLRGRSALCNLWNAGENRRLVSVMVML